jgi:alpha-glucosidase
VLLAKAGSVVAVNRAEQHFARPADARGFHVFPYRGRGTFFATSFEDDGESDAYLNGAFREWALSVDCAERIHIAVSQTGALARYDETIHFILPITETRKVALSGAKFVGESQTSEGRIVVATL